MASVGNWLTRFIFRSFIYLFGILIVFIIIGGVAFVVARPQINDFVNKEIKKYGVELDSWDVSLTGKANLYNVRVPFNDGTIITVRELSVRPPISSFKGVADLSDLKIERNDITVVIPQLHVDGIALNDKDPAITSKKLQILKQVGVSSIRASDIDLVLSMNNTEEKATIKGFALDNLDKGKIAFVGFDAITTQSSLSLGDFSGLRLQSGAASAKNIDVASAFAFVENSLSANDTIIDVLGAVNLKDVKLDTSLSDGQKIHVDLGALKSDGLSLRNTGRNPLTELKAAWAVWKNKDATKEELSKAVKELVLLLENIAKVNGSLSNLIIDTPVVKLSIDDFELTPSEWNKVIPEALLVKADHVIFDLADIPNEKVQALRDMGYGQLDLSFLMNMKWNSQDNSLDISELSFTGKDIGQATLSGKLKNITPAFFTGDQIQMIAGASTATLQSLDMAFSDYGALDRIIKWGAPWAGVSEAELRDRIKEIAVESPPRLLKNHKDGKAIAEAFGSFVDNPGTVNIHLVAKAPNGLGLFDFMVAQNDPEAFLDKLDLRVTSTSKPN